jgi:hypothetical protein
MNSKQNCGSFLVVIFTRTKIQDQVLQDINDRCNLFLSWEHVIPKNTTLKYNRMINS